MKQIFIVNRAFFFFYSVYVCDCVCVCTYTRLFSVYGCRVLQVVLLSHAGCSHDEHRCAYCKLVSLTACCLSVFQFVACLSGRCLCLTVHWSVGQSSLVSRTVEAFKRICMRTAYNPTQPCIPCMLWFCCCPQQVLLSLINTGSC